MISSIFPTIVEGLFWSVCVVVLLIALAVVVKILVLVVRGLTDED